MSSQSGNWKEWSVHVPSTAQNYRTYSTDIPGVLTADNSACMIVCNWYYQAFGWFHDENKEETRLN